VDVVKWEADGRRLALGVIVSICAAAAGKVAGVAGVELHMGDPGVVAKSAENGGFGETFAILMELVSQMAYHACSRDLAGLVFPKDGVVRFKPDRRRQHVVKAQLGRYLFSSSEVIQMVEGLEWVSGDVPSVLAVFGQQVSQGVVLAGEPVRQTIVD
jgi:hypothetical protein